MKGHILEIEVVVRKSYKLYTRTRPVLSIEPVVFPYDALFFSGIISIGPCTADQSFGAEHDRGGFSIRLADGDGCDSEAISSGYAPPYSKELLRKFAHPVCE